jgi:hypothetical protein
LLSKFNETLELIYEKIVAVFDIHCPCYSS